MSAVTEEWVCTGKRYTADDQKMYQSWYTLKKDGVVDLESPHFFSKKGIVSYSAIGGVYAVTSEKTENGGTSVTLRGEAAPKYLYRIDDEALITGWQAETAAAEAQSRLDKKEDAELSVDVLRECLKPIIAAYHKTDFVGRRIIIATVIEYISRNQRLKPEKR